MSTDKKVLYHTSFSMIKEPDVHYGRINSDFGQGFYLSDNEEFSMRWARDHKGSNTYINKYELDLSGLKVKSFGQDPDWFDFISNNRHAYTDLYKDFDVIEGPIANDTIFETYGIISSGIYDSKQALKLLQIGPQYFQYVVKSEKALKQLKWLSAEVIRKDDIKQMRNKVAEEEKLYQQQLVKAMEEMDG